MNSIPESAAATIDFRSTSADELLRLEVALHRAVEDAVEFANAHARSLQLAPSRPAGISPSAKLATVPLRNCPTIPRCSKLFGQSIASSDLKTIVRLGSTDANIPLSLEVPALSLGAGGEGGGAHTQAEWYSSQGPRDWDCKRVVLLTLAMLEWAADQ